MSHYYFTTAIVNVCLDCFLIFLLIWIRYFLDPGDARRRITAALIVLAVSIWTSITQLVQSYLGEDPGRDLEIYRQFLFRLQVIAAIWILPCLVHFFRVLAQDSDRKFFHHALIGAAIFSLLTFSPQFVSYSNYSIYSSGFLQPKCGFLMMFFLPIAVFVLFHEVYYLHRSSIEWKYFLIAFFSIAGITGIIDGTNSMELTRIPTSFEAGLTILNLGFALVVLRFFINLYQENNALYENSPAGLFHLSQNGIIVRSNASFKRILGIDSRGECLNFPFFEIFVKKNEKKNFLDSLLDDKVVHEFEAEFLHQEGHQIWVAITAQYQQGPGKGKHIEGALMDITARKEAEKTILAYQKELQALYMRMSVAEEKERRRISAVLHDLIGQNLILAMNYIQIYFPEPEESPQNIISLLQRILDDTRTLTMELSPPLLYDLGLESALEWLSEDIRQKYELKIKIRDDGQEKPLSSDAKALVFRSVRELLINVAKHAKSQDAVIFIKREKEWLNVTVKDEGCGFQAGESQGLDILSRNSYGLFSIWESMRGCGGGMVIDSTPQKGTSVTFHLPLEDRKGEEKGGDYDDQGASG